MVLQSPGKLQSENMLRHSYIIVIQYGTATFSRMVNTNLRGRDDEVSSSHGYSPPPRLGLGALINVANCKTRAHITYDDIETAHYETMT